MRTNTTHNKIKNALVETFGLDGYKAAFATCQTSKRFGVLEAIAGHDDDDAFTTLILFAAKLANNPKSRAQVKWVVS